MILPESSTTTIRRAIVVFMLMTVISCHPRKPVLRSARTEAGIEISEGASKVLFYQVKPKSLDGRFERAGYVHPLYSLRENVITEDFPEDHLHHHGIFSAWHQILLGDSSIGDGWMSENISWDVVKADVLNEGDGIAIQSEILWNALLSGAKEPIVRENLRITVHESDHQHRVIDYDFTLQPLKDSLCIGGSNDNKGYGGFSLRLKLPADIRFLASGTEVTPQVGAVNAGPWMNFAGSFDGSGSPRSGVVVMCHPSNPGTPQPWILRKEKSMQNPVFPGRTPVMLKQQGLNFRYRIIVHNDSLAEDQIESMYQQYAR